MGTHLKRVGKDGLARRLNQNVVVIRHGSREFYQHLDIFYEVKQRIEGVVARVMPNRALDKYEGINLQALLRQECVILVDLQKRLDVLYSLAKEAKPKFDEFGRNLLQQLGLEPDKVMLEQADLS